MNTQWYIEYSDGTKLGPISTFEAKKLVQRDNSGFAWKEGYSNWRPMAKISDFHEIPNSLYRRQHVPSSLGTPSNSDSDVIDYEIYGEEIQYVEIELDPKESVVAESGGMMYKDTSIEMSTIFGDGRNNENSGFFGKVLGAGKRLLSGERLFMTLFTHEGRGKAKVAFAAPYSGKIIPVDLAQIGGTLICQKTAFLCAAKGVSIDIHFQKKIMTGLFGGEGFVMQKLEGNGMAFIHAGGMLKEIELKKGEVLHLDTGCLVAMEPSVTFDIERSGSIKTGFLAGEGFFFAKVEGAGKVWIQSLPFSRLAEKILSLAPSTSTSSSNSSSMNSHQNNSDENEWDNDRDDGDDGETSSEE